MCEYYFGLSLDGWIRQIMGLCICFIIFPFFLGVKCHNNYIYKVKMVKKII